jgi:hypothetical protein
MTGHRHPYVGEGADGARRSAQIDREEAGTLDRADPRRAALEASAERWEIEAGERPAAPGELCTCGRQAIVVYLGSVFGPTGFCGRNDGGDRAGPCPFCGGPRHGELAGRCPDYRLRLEHQFPAAERAQEPRTAPPEGDRGPPRAVAGMLEPQSGRRRERRPGLGVEAPGYARGLDPAGHRAQCAGSRRGVAWDRTRVAPGPDYPHRPLPGLAASTRQPLSAPHLLANISSRSGAIFTP